MRKGETNREERSIYDEANERPGRRRTIGISSERPESALASSKERRWRRRRSSFEGGIVRESERERMRECRKRKHSNFFIKLTKNITN